LNNTSVPVLIATESKLCALNQPDTASWWPGEILRQHPVNRVYLCDRQTEQPAIKHAENLLQLAVPLSGCYETHVRSGGRALTLQLKPGTALFAPPNGWNRPTWRRPVRLMSLLFGDKRLRVTMVTNDCLTNGDPKVRRFSKHWPLTGPLPRILDAMVELHAAGGPLAALPELTRALLHCLNDATSRRAAKTASPSKSLLREACAYLQDHHEHDISREGVARHFGVSPNYLSRLFQLHGRMTFSGYLTQVRTDQAKQLLGSYHLKLDDVAARCGYGDTAYFCRVFKRLAGITPASYRAQFGQSPAVPPPANGHRSSPASSNVLDTKVI
jgi:AraC-like DNA-binding protein